MQKYAAAVRFYETIHCLDKDGQEYFCLDDATKWSPLKYDSSYEINELKVHWDLQLKQNAIMNIEIYKTFCFLKISISICFVILR